MLGDNMSNERMINTNLHGRIRNTHLSKNNGFMTVYEAVVNSIHAIEELSEDGGKGNISLEIIRSDQTEASFGDTKKPGPETKPDITSFKIQDSGIGFNEQNMESFCTLDSEYKANKGCKGVGRLLWLKVFERVHVESDFIEDGVLCHRQFDFDADQGIHNDRKTQSSASTSSTTISLINVKEIYRQYARKNIDTIARDILNHCLWYYIRPGSAPSITVKDEDTVIQLDDLCADLMVTQEKPTDITIGNHSFSLTHILLPARSANDHTLVYCAGNRVVTEKKLRNLIPGLYGRLKKDSEEFIYYCYVTSQYLDENVRLERTGFDIEDDYPDMLQDDSLTFKQIESAVLECVKSYLHDYIQHNIEAGRAHIKHFVDTVAPKYKPILSLISPEELNVDPDASEKDLDLLLHNKTRDIEQASIVEGHELFKNSSFQDTEQYIERFNRYKETIKELNQSKLADYVINRRSVIDLLEKALEWDCTGKYSKEEIVHDLIMPMGKTSDTENPDTFNLWLIDEKLTFHNYLASDKTIKSIPLIASESTKEPDILALKGFDTPILISETNQFPLPSITIIEIKRPQRNDYKEGEEKDPIEQALEYIERIREGRSKTDVGRPIPSSEAIPGFCYIVADLTPSLRKRCKIHALQMTSDELGYFGYQPHYKTYIEVYSFDRLVKEAKERNRAFFDKLGLPCN